VEVVGVTVVVMAENKHAINVHNYSISRLFQMKSSNFSVGKFLSKLQLCSSD